MDWYAINILVVKRSNAGFIFGNCLEDKEDLMDKALQNIIKFHRHKTIYR